MGTAFSAIRRLIAQEMDLWAGDMSTGLPGTFSAVDAAGSLTTLIDTNRVEPDDEFDSSYICINPGGTGNVALATIWRRIADVGGYVSATGTIFLTTAVPNSSYAATGMTYEIYKMFRPEHWMAGVNSALRSSFPQRHRLVQWEIQEDPDTAFYNWGNMVSQLAITDPTTAPTVTAVTLSDSTWIAGTYKFAISYYNSLGDTLVTSTTTLAIGAGQAPQFASITVPEQVTGVYYWATPAPGGSQLTRLTTGDGSINSGTSGRIVGVAGLDFVVQQVVFDDMPGKLNVIPPVVNTTAVDVIKLTGLWRRTNPGLFPERYVDLSPDRWREVGGQVLKIEFSPNAQYSLHFIGMSPPIKVVNELDIITEPDEVVIAGAEWYLWELLNKTSSAQNEAAWVVEAKNAQMRFKEACGRFKLTAPRRTMRRPFIGIYRGELV